MKAWGVDGHNSHTNICSSGARTGYSLWHKHDRPSPDHSNAKVILLTSSHLETGHYFNPHAQRILEGMIDGAKLIVIDPRLENWVNWEDWLNADHPDEPCTFERFISLLLEEYEEYTPEFAASECRIPVEQVIEAGEAVANAGSRLSTHVWRSAAIGNLGGWQVSRTLHLLNVLTGSVGTEGGTSPNSWSKFSPELFDEPGDPDGWNELHFPPEYTLAHYEMSHILPHLIRDGRGEIDVYFTRVFNPVRT